MLNTISKERIFRQMPENSEDSLMGLSRRVRRHLAETCGVIGAGDPLVLKMINVHGQRAEALMQELRELGQEVKILEVGSPYAIEKLNPKHPFRYDWVSLRIHTHYGC